MQETMTAQQVALAILDGAFDGDLDALATAVSERRKSVRQREGQLNAMFLKAGDRVTLKGLSPKYLNGTVVEVVAIKQTRMTVKAIEGVTNPRASQKIGYGGYCTVPLSCAEKAE